MTPLQKVLMQLAQKEKAAEEALQGLMQVDKLAQQHGVTDFIMVVSFGNGQQALVTSMEWPEFVASIETIKLQKYMAHYEKE